MSTTSLDIVNPVTVKSVFSISIGVDEWSDLIGLLSATVRQSPLTDDTAFV